MSQIMTISVRVYTLRSHNMSLDMTINDRVCTVRNRAMTHDIHIPTNSAMSHDIIGL